MTNDHDDPTGSVRCVLCGAGAAVPSGVEPVELLTYPDGAERRSHDCYDCGRSWYVVVPHRRRNG